MAWAEVPQLIAYQGRFTERDGSPLTGEHAIIFRVYDVETGGGELWEETHRLTLNRDDNGIASVVLGSLTPLGSLSFTRSLWLAIAIDADGELLPRQRLTAVGYALNADTLDGLDSQQFARVGPGAPAGQITSAQIADGAVTLADLASDSVGADQLRSDAIRAGDLEAADLPDHVHQGVHSLAVSGQAGLSGDVTLAAGSNVTLSQAGQQITIASAGGSGSPGARVSASSSTATAIGTDSDTTLLSVSFTKSQAASVALIIASVQLTHTGPPNNKTVDVKLFRDGTQLDSTFTVRLGMVNQAVSDLPVSLHTWDEPGAGTYTITLKAMSSGNGATATIRRLSVVELP